MVSGKTLQASHCPASSPMSLLCSSVFLLHRLDRLANLPVFGLFVLYRFSLNSLSVLSFSFLFQLGLSSLSPSILSALSTVSRHWLATDLPLTVHWSLPSISVIRSALSDLPSKNYQLNTLTLHGQDLCRQRFAKEWAADSLALRIQLKNWFLSAKINCFNCCAPTVQAHRSLWQAWTRLNFFIFDDFLVD